MLHIDKYKVKMGDTYCYIECQDNDYVGLEDKLNVSLDITKRDLDYLQGYRGGNEIFVLRDNYHGGTTLSSGVLSKWDFLIINI